MVSKPGAPRPSPVLAVGAGRTTLCEVHIRSGPPSIVIEPCTDDEIRAHVADFADKILYTTREGGEGGGSRDEQIMSREVERAVRNMANLRRPSARRRPERRQRIPHVSWRGRLSLRNRNGKRAITT